MTPEPIRSWQAQTTVVALTSPCGCLHACRKTTGTGHELQWRGGSRLFDGRASDVETIYRSSESSQVRDLLDRYGIRYVYHGHREMESYGGENLKNFGFLKPVFSSHDVTIYEYLP